MIKRGDTGQTKLGWKTIEDCMPDLRLAQSSESDLGHSSWDQIGDMDL